MKSSNFKEFQVVFTVFSRNEELLIFVTEPLKNEIDCSQIQETSFDFVSTQIWSGGKTPRFNLILTFSSSHLLKLFHVM